MKIKREYYKVNLENPIKSKKEDVFGFDYEVKRIKNAIKDDANIIGIVSEYGSGKSSLIRLLSNKLCCLRYKVIKVNLWDNSLKNLIQENDKKIPSKESIIKLHKTFLRQISMQTNKYNAAYINRRINANYGAAKIAFPSYHSLIKWFLIYSAILIGLLYLTCKFGFGISSFSSITLKDKNDFITFMISKLPTLLIGFAFFYIIFNKEVLFSFWNNSKSREITEEDTIQIYNELFGKQISFLPRLRKIVIIIEDLDRIEDNELVEFYLNEFYRLYVEGNEKNRKGITMIVCLKDNKKNSYESRYIKIFDYISYINQINIDDNEKILSQLVRKDKLLYDLCYNKELQEVDVSKLSWLIYGDKINIRTIKRRIEHFKNIYLMIFSRGREKENKNNDLDIDLTTCSFVAYLKTEFNSELDDILSKYDSDGSNFIDKSVNKRIIGDMINTDENDSDNIKKVKELLVNMINSGYIDSQYKKYFYNFPKGTKIYTTTEKYVSDFIQNDSNTDEINIKNVLSIFNEVDDEFIYNRIKSINSLGKDIPEISLYESKSFNIAKKINKEKLNEKYKSMLSLNNKNIDKVCNIISLLKESNIDKKELSSFISNIVKENLKIETIDLNIIYRFRKSLIDCFGPDVSKFSELYKDTQISKEELFIINDIDTLISVSGLIKHDDDIDALVSTQYNNIESENKDSYLLPLLETFSDWKAIYNIDISNMKSELKSIIYQNICSNSISNNEKLDLLLYLDYNDLTLAEDLISKNDVDDNKMIKYLNKQKECTEKIIAYVVNSSKLFDISDIIFNALEFESEKYYAYSIYRNHHIPNSCDNNMISNLFLKYSEITRYLNEKIVVEILKQEKVFKKFNNTNITKEKVMTLIIVQQTKEMIKSIIDNYYISNEIKCSYIESIKLVNKNASTYILSLISTSTPVELIKSIRKNKNNIFSNYNRFDKAKITKKIDKVIASMQ